MFSRATLGKKLVLAMLLAGAVGILRADIYSTASDTLGDGYILRTDGLGTTTVFSTGYLNPQGIGFNSQSILFVADADGLHTVDNNGTSTVFASLSPLYSQSGIAIDPGDNVYIADDTDQIRKYNSSGVLQSSWAAFEGPSSLIFNSLDGNLYATNMIDDSVGTYDGLGVYTEFVDLSTYDPTFFPVGIALDDFGNLYVSGGLDLDQIIKITPLGVISPYVTTGLTGVAGMQWNGTALVIADQACGCGPDNTLKLSDGLGGVTLISNLGEEYMPFEVAIGTPVPEPGTWILLSAGLLGVTAFRTRHKA